LEDHIWWSKQEGEQRRKGKENTKKNADEGKFIFSENGMQNPFEFLRKRRIVDITSNYKSLLQNIVSFIGLFCKRDL